MLTAAVYCMFAAPSMAKSLDHKVDNYSNTAIVVEWDQYYIDQENKEYVWTLAEYVFNFLRLSPGYLDKDAIPLFTRGDNFAGDAMHTRMVFSSDCAFLDFLNKNSESPEIVNLRLAMRSFLKSESGTITGPIPGDLDNKIKAVFPNATKKTGKQIDVYNYGPLIVGFSNTYPKDEDYVGEDIIATFSWVYAEAEQVATDAVKIKELLKKLTLDNGVQLYFT